MAFVPRKALCGTVSPLIQFKRFRAKVNIQRPRKPHFVRATYLALTKPYFINPRKGKTLPELCEGFKPVKEDIEDNPYQRIIGRELYAMLSTSRLVGFFHLNPIKGEDAFKAYVAFKKQNMEYRNYGKKTLETAIKGTPYEVILDFYMRNNMIVFSPEPKVKEIFKINKKFPQLVLLFGIFEGRLVTKDELVEYSKIPNLQTAQAGLVQTLNSLGSQLVSHLNSHQTTLVSHLQERAKQLEEN